jgi:hypothetical protein
MNSLAQLERPRSRGLFSSLTMMGFVALVPAAASAQTVLACYARGTGTVYRTGVPGTPDECVGNSHTPFSWTSFAAASLPFFAQVSGDINGPAPFHIRNTGTGHVVTFELPNALGVGAAIYATVNGSGAGINAVSLGSGQAGRFDADGSGPAGLFSTRNSNNTQPTVDIVNQQGSGPALRARSASNTIAEFVSATGANQLKASIDRLGNAQFLGVMTAAGFNAQVAVDGPGPHPLRIRNTGTGPAATFELPNQFGAGAAVHASVNGSGPAINGVSGGSGQAGRFDADGSGSAGLFSTRNSANGQPTLAIQNFGTGPALVAELAGSASNTIAAFSAGGVKASIDRNGNAVFQGSISATAFNATGADLAEVFEVEGPRSAYEPGDVLVISTASDRRVERSNETYSTRVIGVYATQPGILLSETAIAPSGDRIPVGVVGVIPTKVSAENGPIRRGDILVTATTAGHAMRAIPVEVNGVKVYPGGAMLGKALEEFAGPGVGMIRVLVNVR